MDSRSISFGIDHGIYKKLAVSCSEPNIPCLKTRACLNGCLNSMLEKLEIRA
jgi:hypothetical protein